MCKKKDENDVVSQDDNSVEPIFTKKVIILFILCVICILFWMLSPLLDKYVPLS